MVRYSKGQTSFGSGTQYPVNALTFRWQWASFFCLFPFPGFNLIVWTGHNTVDLAVWALGISFVKMSQRFWAVFIADLRIHLAFSLFLMWPVLVGIFSPSDSCSILLRPVCGGNYLLEVVIFPFYNTASMKPCWALLTPSWTSAGSYWSPAMPEDEEVTGWTGKGDGVIMYPLAQLVSWRRLYSLRLIPWLPA